MTTKYDALEALPSAALYSVKRYSESSGEGGGVYENDEGDYIRLDDADEFVSAREQVLIADVKALAEALSNFTEGCSVSVNAVEIGRAALARIQGEAG